MVCEFYFNEAVTQNFLKTCTLTFPTALRTIDHTQTKWSSTGKQITHCGILTVPNTTRQ